MCKKNERFSCCETIAINMSYKKRIRILNDDEINRVYGIPKFENNDRAVIFELNELINILTREA